MTMTQTRLGRRLRAARNLAGLDQVGMSRLLKVGRSTISNWETGISEPDATQFVRWAAYTGQPLEWLAEGIIGDEETPAENGGGSMARPEGFEPPTFWSVVAQVPDTAAEIAWPAPTY